METYTIICKIDSQWEFAVWLRKLKQGLCINLEGRDGEGDGREVQKGGDICKQKKELYSVQSLSCLWLFATPRTAAHQASLSITNSRSLLKLISIELVMLSNHLILCRSLLLLPSTCPSTRVFLNESVLCIKWPKYWSFSFSISPFNEYIQD